MKVKVIDYISLSTVIFSILFFLILFLNIFFIIRPIGDYFNDHSWWWIPLSVVLPLGLLLVDRARYKRVNEEIFKLFQTTILTVQDVLQKSSSRIQNIMLDMEEQNVRASLLKEMDDTFNENVRLIQVLSSLNLEDLLKNSNKHLSSFLLKDKGE
ncbi:MAG: hypothetical protein NTX65_05055 [Ignavibacteriales bacterium]|nr:hypothetical protein [Ignavibacteriales bacterium]